MVNRLYELNAFTYSLTKYVKDKLKNIHSMLESIILLTSGQAHKLTDELLGQGIVVTLFRKPAHGEDGGLVSQRTVLTLVRIQASLYTRRGEGVTGWCRLFSAGQTPGGMCDPLFLFLSG